MIEGAASNPRPRSAIYAGRVSHRRVRPHRHALSYRVFNLLLDLDEIDGLVARLRLFSRNRFNLLAFSDGDHGDGSGTPLRDQIERMASTSGVALEGGAIRLLCMPRVLCYVFNPLSVYFCHGRDRALACIVYEARNTFGERHSYVIPVRRDAPDFPHVIRQSCAKAFYVSPFLDIDLTYDFQVRPPGERVGIGVDVGDEAGAIIVTAFAGARRPLSDLGIARAILGHPLLTVKVVAAIHWEALWLWLKGVRLRSRPPPPERAFTAIASDID